MGIPGKVKDYYLEKYGITFGAYTLMLIKQHYKCKICKTLEGKKHLAVDHDHKTGKVRGLLCGPCNRALGSFKDDVDILKKAIIYLEESNKINLHEY